MKKLNTTVAMNALRHRRNAWCRNAAPFLTRGALLIALQASGPATLAEFRRARRQRQGGSYPALVQPRGKALDYVIFLASGETTSRPSPRRRIRSLACPAAAPACLTLRRGSPRTPPPCRALRPANRFQRHSKG